MKSHCRYQSTALVVFFSVDRKGQNCKTFRFMQWNCETAQIFEDVLDTCLILELLNYTFSLQKHFSCFFFFFCWYINTVYKPWIHSEVQEHFSPWRPEYLLVRVFRSEGRCPLQPERRTADRLVHTLQCWLWLWMHTCSHRRESPDSRPVSGPTVCSVFYLSYLYAVSSTLACSQVTSSGIRDKWDICVAAQPNWKMMINGTK